eukprot:7511227-Alexandrium_andersonii.AAC.1
MSGAQRSPASLARARLGGRPTSVQERAPRSLPPASAAHPCSRKGKCEAGEYSQTFGGGDPSVEAPFPPDFRSGRD